MKSLEAKSSAFSLDSLRAALASNGANKLEKRRPPFGGKCHQRSEWAYLWTWYMTWTWSGTGTGAGTWGTQRKPMNRLSYVGFMISAMANFRNRSCQRTTTSLNAISASGSGSESGPQFESTGIQQIRDGAFWGRVDDSHGRRKHEPNKKPICTQIYFQNARDAHHSNREVERLWARPGLSLHGNWTPDADKSLASRRRRRRHTSPFATMTKQEARCVARSWLEESR